MLELATPSPAINRPLASRTARCGNETLAAIPSSSVLVPSWSAAAVQLVDGP